MNKKRYAGLYWTRPDKWDKLDTKGIETVSLASRPPPTLFNTPRLGGPHVGSPHRCAATTVRW